MSDDALRIALSAAYMELLRQPQSEFRIHNQALYAHVRDAIAELYGWTAEAVQNDFEASVATENRK